MSQEAYRQKAEAKIDEYRAKLSEARAKAKGASADARLEAERHIDQLEGMIEVGKKKLAELGDAADDSWDDLAKTLDNAWKDVAGGIQKALDRFK